MKLKKEFAHFYKEIRIDREQDSLIEKREILVNDIKEKLPNIMKEHNIEINKSDIRAIDQGSYKYNTTIRADVVDRDVAIMIPLSIMNNPDPRRIKGYLRDSINCPSRVVDIKEPCVRATYFEHEKEWLHIDLPMYAIDGDSIYLARGKAESNHYSWESADPDGLNEDLCKKINGHDQLRRIICFIKKWKSVSYEGVSNDHKIPPSIGLTYLACDCFSQQTCKDGDDDLLALQRTMQAILNRFSVTRDKEGNIVSANITRYLQVKPGTDIFEKMRKSSVDYMIIFYEKLLKAVDNLTNAVNVESDHDAGKYVRKVLGIDFEVPEKQAVVSTIQSKREHNFG